MLLKRSKAFWLCLGLVLAPSAAHANVGDVLAAPFKWVGGAIGGGAADKFKGALDKTLVDVDARLVKHEDRVAGLADQLVSSTKDKVDSSVDHVNHALEARILQLKTSADDSVDRALGQVDGIAKDGILQLQAAGHDLIADADQTVDKALDHADAILRVRSREVGRMADELVTHADAAVEARISQVDEAAGRRLGNVDVIASKQRLALEQGGLRLAALIGIVVFVVFVLRALFTAYNRALEQGLLEGMRGTRRSARVLGAVTPALARSALAALAGVGLLLGLQRWLPSSAAQEAESLAQTHVLALRAAVTKFDAVEARFHASQLQYLQPEASAHYTGLADKAVLLRDLIARPALLSTQKSLAEFAARVSSVERALGPRPDPDVLVMRAILAWNTGLTRAEEHRAASLCGRALRLAPTGFALLPLARAYVETFLDAPYVPDDVSLDRDAASLDELEAAADGAVPDPADSPLVAAVTLARSMRTLQRASGANYVALARAQAQIVAATRKRERVPSQLFEERRARAQAIVDDWIAFDRGLQATDGATGPLVLSVFRLNDAVFTRAAWVLAHPDSTEAAKALTELHGADTLALRLKLAPPRIAWARRYGTYFESARAIVEFEEAERFRAWERWSIEFESALIAYELADTKSDEQQLARWRVVVAASSLALYVETPDGPRPFSREIASGLSVAPKPLAPRAKKGPVSFTIAGAPATLQDALLARGPRTI